MKSSEFIKIADLLAKQYKIKVFEGDCWAANIKNKEDLKRYVDQGFIIEEL